MVAALAAIGGAIVWGWIRVRGRLFAAGPTPSYDGLRLRDFAWSMALFWSVAILLFTTFFTNLRGGLLDRHRRQLGYWPDAARSRARQPTWFYYLLLSGALRDPAAGRRLDRDRGGEHALRRSSWDPARGDLGSEDIASEPDAAQDGAAVASVGRSDLRSFFSFLLWWAIAAWGAYTWAGEKMPWLVTHLMLPLEIFAGWGIARLISLARASSKAGALALVAGGAVLPVLALEWIAGPASAGAKDRRGRGHHEVGGVRSRSAGAAGVRGPRRVARRYAAGGRWLALGSAAPSSRSRCGQASGSAT